MKKVISVRFKDNGKTYYFDPADTPIQTGDYVIVETASASVCSRLRKPIHIPSSAGRTF